jgi:hypothetical protein
MARRLGPGQGSDSILNFFEIKYTVPGTPRNSPELRKALILFDVGPTTENLLMKRLFQSITVMIVVAFAAGCATTPALHVIGVYEGQTPPGVDDRPWWAKCNDDKNDSRSNVALASLTECHRKYAGIHTEKEVAVSVSDESRPIVLALTAYDRTHWKVFLKGDVKLTKVILAGYHSQRVSGIPAETPIEAYTYDPSPCERCWQGASYFYSYKSPSGQLKEITGLEVTSFQGRYKGTEFSIFPGMKKRE